ncbi:MAG: hypothetical protein NXI09_15720 [Bacteroidetes bacterium]|nr:hypothetical protein [Bacteroidota bacterium]
MNIERRGKAYQEALLLQEHLSSNWDQSIYIWETNSGLSFEGDSLSTWMFEDSIVRVNERFYFHFEKVLLRTYGKAWKAEKYLIDSIYLTIRFSRSDSLNLFFQKKYPPAISIEGYGYID